MRDAMSGAQDVNPEYRLKAKLVNLYATQYKSNQSPQKTAKPVEQPAQNNLLPEIAGVKIALAPPPSSVSRRTSSTLARISWINNFSYSKQSKK